MSSMAESASKASLSAVTEGQPNPQLPPNSTAVGGGGQAGGVHRQHHQQPSQRGGKKTKAGAAAAKTGGDGRVAKPERRSIGGAGASGRVVSGPVRQELRRTLPSTSSRVSSSGSKEAVTVVQAERQKRTSRRSSNFNYTLEDSDEDSDCGE